MLQNRSQASLEDQSLRYQTELTKTTPLNKTTLHFAYNHEQNIFSDTLARLYNNNQVQSYMGSYQMDWNLKQGMLTFKSMYYAAFGSSKNYTQTAEQSYVNLSSKYAFYNKKIKGQVSAAFLMAKGGYYPLTAFGSLNYSLKPSWTLYFATGNAFRLPTLNERFWSPGGNENILPEESYHVELGINKQTPKWGFKDHVYFTPTKNLVVWRPISGNVVSPINLSDEITLLCGNEFSANQILHHKKWKWELIESYHLNLARAGGLDYWDKPQLPYVPLHRASAELRVAKKNLSFWYMHQWASARTIDLDNTTPLENYTIANLVMQWEHKQFTTGLQLNNIFNTQYQLLVLRPMPGFNVQLNFNYLIEYKK